MTTTLILGGTAQLGRAIARDRMARGHAVTCLARGVSGEAVPGARLVLADRVRPDAYTDVAAQEWDEVVELAWDRALVAGALDALAARTAHWTLVSSVSVYASHGETGADESAALVDPGSGAGYAQDKVAAERASAAVLGDRLLVARAGLIAGPGDVSDRTGYWVGRLALAGAGPVLVPDREDLAVQLIDVRDLAGWLGAAAERGATGTVDTVGPSLPWETFLASAARVAGFSGELRRADDAWLAAHDVAHWAGPRSLPLWLPGDHAGFCRRAGSAYVEAGGFARPLREMLVDLLADERERGLDRPRRAGLTRAEELELLDQPR